MIHLSYDGIPFRTLAFDHYQVATLTSDDEVDALYLEYDFGVTVTIGLGQLGSEDFHRALNKKRPELGGIDFDRVRNWDLHTPEIMVLLEERLRIPRRPLVVWSYVNKPQGLAGGVAPVIPPQGPGGPLPGGGQLNNQLNQAIKRVNILESPLRKPDGTYYPTDARHGPWCKVISSRVDKGTGSIELQLQFVTWVGINKSPEAGAIVSNRWSFAVEHDEDNYATHVIEGKVYFRQDMLKRQNLKADDYRAFFMHPCPPGFKRNASAPVFHSDGCFVTYTIVDTEQPTDKPGIGGYGASRVEVIHQREHVVPNWAQSAFSSAARMMGG